MATEHTISQKEREAIPHDTAAESQATPPQANLKVATSEQGKKEGNANRDRELGKSVLPFTRVQKIMKADKDLPMVARDATFLISLATEEFIRKLSQACQKLAEREKRTIVQQKDVASIVRRAEEFLFLEEVIGSQESTGKRKPQKTKNDVSAPSDQDQLQPTLHNFMQKLDEDQGTEEISNIITDEDGVVHAE